MKNGNYGLLDGNGVCNIYHQVPYSASFDPKYMGKLLMQGNDQNFPSH